jgi:hypothetical protein
MNASALLATVAIIVSFLATGLHLVIGFDETAFLIAFVCYWGVVLFSFVSLGLLELVQILKENK